MNGISRPLGGFLLSGLITAAAPIAAASDHNEPAADAVWPADSALHQEWDISDLFAWYDHQDERLNLIVAWHPQQLPRRPTQQTDYSDGVLYTIHLRQARDWEINIRYGRNDAGEWGMLVTGLPGRDRVVLDCEAAKGWREHDLGGGIQVASGMFDDPFVFDLKGYNDSLKRANNDERGLEFDPENDTFERHNVTAFVLSLPKGVLEKHWGDFDFAEDIHLWVSTRVTDKVAEE